MRNRRIARVSAVAALAAAISCSSIEPLPPAAHVVPASVSPRANVVLRNCIEEFGSADGRWQGSLSPGCTQIWATQFGYRAGVRRDRDDIVAVGIEEGAEA